MALKEAVDDETFRKVKRMSYSNNAAEEVSHAMILFTRLQCAVSNKFSFLILFKIHNPR